MKLLTFLCLFTTMITWIILADILIILTTDLVPLHAAWVVSNLMWLMSLFYLN